MARSNLLFISLLLASAAGVAYSCRTLALSGGGAYGAYEAGVMSGLIEVYGGKANWTKVAGVSAGSLNAAWITQYNVGDEYKGVEELKARWLNTTQADIYKNWPGSYVEGLLLQSGLYDTSPLRDYLTKNLDLDSFRSSDRDWVVGATNVDTGDYTQFEKASTEDPISAVMASSAWPIFFPLVPIGKYHYSDGGAKVNVPILDSFTECTTEIDVIITSGASMGVVNASSYNTVQLSLRALDILERDVVEKDIQLAQYEKQLKDVKLRIIRPSQSLPGGGLSFDPADTQKMIDIGIQDAKNSQPTSFDELSQLIRSGELKF